MNHEANASAQTAAPPTLLLESPQPHAPVFDQCISFVGVVNSERRPKTLRVLSDDICLDSTHFFTPAAPTGDARFGFRVLARFPQPATDERDVSLRIEVELGDADQSVELGQVQVRLLPARLHERPYGDVVAPDRAELLHRENIYGFGPPLEQPSELVTRLLLDFLPFETSVLDIGCGAGAYGPPLLAAGHRWVGAEIQEACWPILERRGLPFQRLVAGQRRWPFGDGGFDAAIAIEVLEHVTELDVFVAELARVTRTRLLVSVPNMEVLPYYAPLGVVPWHLLESTHVNFFTRASLRAALAPHFRDVEVFSYAEPSVKTHEKVALHAHLFAVADR